MHAFSPYMRIPAGPLMGLQDVAIPSFAEGLSGCPVQLEGKHERLCR